MGLLQGGVVVGLLQGGVVVPQKSEKKSRAKNLTISEGPKSPRATIWAESKKNHFFFQEVGLLQGGGCSSPTTMGGVVVRLLQGGV